MHLFSSHAGLTPRSDQSAVTSHQYHRTRSCLSCCAASRPSPHQHPTRTYSRATRARSEKYSRITLTAESLGGSVAYLLSKASRRCACTHLCEHLFPSLVTTLPLVVRTFIALITAVVLAGGAAICAARKSAWLAALVSVAHALVVGRMGWRMVPGGKELLARNLLSVPS